MAGPAAPPGFLTTTLQKAVSWARNRSMWPATFGLACCAIEMMATGAAHYDLARFGMEVFRPRPRQADLMIVAGRVSARRWPRCCARSTTRCPSPSGSSRWACAPAAAGMFNNYAIVQGVDQIVPVDVYVPGLPARARDADARHPHAPRDDPHRRDLRRARQRRPVARHRARRRRRGPTADARRTWPRHADGRDGDELGERRSATTSLRRPGRPVPVPRRHGQPVVYVRRAQRDRGAGPARRRAFTMLTCAPSTTSSRPTRAACARALRGRRQLSSHAPAQPADPGGRCRSTTRVPSLTAGVPGRELRRARDVRPLRHHASRATPTSPASSCPTTGRATRCARTTRALGAGDFKG